VNRLREQGRPEDFLKKADEFLELQFEAVQSRAGWEKPQAALPAALARPIFRCAAGRADLRAGACGMAVGASRARPSYLSLANVPSQRPFFASTGRRVKASVKVYKDITMFLTIIRILAAPRISISQRENKHATF